MRGRNGVKEDWFPLVSWECFVQFSFLQMSCGAVPKWHFCTIRTSWRAQRCSMLDNRSSTSRGPTAHCQVAPAVQRVAFLHRPSEPVLLCSWHGWHKRWGGKLNWGLNYSRTLSLRPPDKSDHLKIADTQIQSLQFADVKCTECVLENATTWEMRHCGHRRSGPKLQFNLGKDDHIRQNKRKTLFQSSSFSLAGTPDGRSSRLQAWLAHGRCQLRPRSACGNYFSYRSLMTMARAGACVQVHIEKFWTKPAKWDHLRNRTAHSQSLRWSASSHWFDCTEMKNWRRAVGVSWRDDRRSSPILQAIFLYRMRWFTRSLHESWSSTITPRSRACVTVFIGVPLHVTAGMSVVDRCVNLAIWA